MELSSLQTFAAVNMEAVVRHIGPVHAHNAGSKFAVVNVCPRTYQNFASYRNHFYRVTVRSTSRRHCYRSGLVDVTFIGVD